MPEAPPDNPRQLMPAALKSAFDVAVKAAAGVIRRRTRLLGLVANAYKKAAGEDDVIARVRDDLRLLLRLARAWGRREYTGIPLRSLLYIVGAILYFVNPIDLIPDALGAIGFIDDMAVIALVVNSLRDDLDAFKTWESRRESTSDALVLEES